MKEQTFFVDSTTECLRWDDMRCQQVVFVFLTTESKICVLNMQFLQSLSWKCIASLFINLGFMRVSDFSEVSERAAGTT